MEAKEREKRISAHMQEVHQLKMAEKKADEVNKDDEKKRWVSFMFVIVIWFLLKGYFLSNDA